MSRLVLPAQAWTAGLFWLEHVQMYHYIQRVRYMLPSVMIHHMLHTGPRLQGRGARHPAQGLVSDMRTAVYAVNKSHLEAASCRNSCSGSALCGVVYVCIYIYIVL